MDDRGRTDPQPHVLFLFVSHYWADNFFKCPPLISRLSMCSHNLEWMLAWQVACLYHYIYIPLGFGVLSSSASFFSRLVVGGEGLG